MKDSAIFIDSMSIDVRTLCSPKYEPSYNPSISPDTEIHPVSAYDRITLEAKAIPNSSMSDIIDSLISELQKYKEGLKK